MALPRALMPTQGGQGEFCRHPGPDNNNVPFVVIVVAALGVVNDSDDPDDDDDDDIVGEAFNFFWIMMVQ